MGLPSERNRAANKGGPLLIIGMIAYLSEESQIICGSLIKILGKAGIRCVQNRNYPSSFPGSASFNWKLTLGPIDLKAVYGWALV
jgi:hypothetical protein